MFSCLKERMSTNNHLIGKLTNIITSRDSFQSPNISLRNRTVDFREFTKGGLVKGGLAIYAFPLCNCNALGSVFNVQIENTPNC